jgi:ankyrin repeat protein
MEGILTVANLESDFLGAVETHSVEELLAAFDAGLDPRGTVEGKPLVAWLTEMYARSDRFADCLRLLLDRGAPINDPLALPVLLDDADGIAGMVATNPAAVAHRTTIRAAFTPLEDATLLHVAAEFGNGRAVQKLIELGADVNARAGVDEYGLGGQTPLFHTVNSNANRSAPIMQLLLDAGARVDVRLEGLVWGRGYEWETTLFDVTPISYAQLGNLPQMHRKEEDIAANVRALLEAAGRKAPPLANVPNQYLRPRS